MQFLAELAGGDGFQGSFAQEAKPFHHVCRRDVKSPVGRDHGPIAVAKALDRGDRIAGRNGVDRRPGRAGRDVNEAVAGEKGEI